MDSQLKWKEHIQHVRQKCFISLYKLRRVSYFLPTPTWVKIYNALVLPHLDYCCVLWHSCGSVLTQNVEQIQNYGMRIITSSCRYTPSETLRSKLHWMTLSQRQEVFQLSLVHRCIHSGAPKYLHSKFTLNREMQYARTRGQNNIHLRRPCTNFYWNSFEFQAALSWNRLPSELTNSAACKVGQPWITNLRVMWTDGWVMSKCTQDSQKVCTKVLSLPDNAKKLNF